MSTFSHTDWTVICNGTNEDGSPCPLQWNTGSDGGDTAGDARRWLKKRGWLVSVRPANGYPRRMDFCPAHKGQAAAVREGGQ